MFLPEEITATKPPMRMASPAVDLHLGSPAAPAIDFHERILAIAQDANPVGFVAIVMDLNERILAVAHDFNPAPFFPVPLDLNHGVLPAVAVDLDARSCLTRRIIAPGVLGRAARDGQAGEREAQASNSRATR